MMVLRVTTTKIGNQVKTILNDYLDLTARQGHSWKDADNDGWQLFDVIGDFGFGEGKHLAQKMSHWSRTRCSLILPFPIALLLLVLLLLLLLCW